MSGLNAAVVMLPGTFKHITASLKAVADCNSMIAVTNNSDFQQEIGAIEHLTFDMAGLDAAPFDSAIVSSVLKQTNCDTEGEHVFVVDMEWGLETPAASANFDVWGALCSDLSDEGLKIISVYDWQLLIGDQILAALRGHSHFLAGKGLCENPFWLPNSYLTTASLREQVSFLLGRIVPDWSTMVLPPAADLQAAVGTDPGWLPHGQLGPMVGLGTRWKIRCFGRLRIYTSASQQIDWRVSGGSPRKTKTLFAFLLTRGESGASADRIAELLWPDDDDEAAKRGRLHHTVAMLRKVLGSKSFIERRGEYYYLCPPQGTWIDIQTFEQFCRRAKTLERSEQQEAAFTMLQAAERLYSGVLFEDIPSEYLESETEDWCLPKRAWLQDMALKVHRDMAAILRQRGDLRDALKQCHRALEMDPACEIAHEEAMRIFHAQGRQEAVARQFRQYKDALSALGGSPSRPPLQSIFETLVSNN